MKFLNLLKKELHELINVQMIIGLVVTVGLLMSVGNMMSNVMDDATSETGTVNISDRDDTDFTRNIISSLESAGFEVNRVNEDNADRAKLLESADCDSLIIIPKGFTDEALDSAFGDNTVSGGIELITSLKSTSALASMKDKTSAAADIISNMVKNEFMTQKGLSEAEISKIDVPLNINEVTVVNGKTAAVSPEVLTGMIQSQGMLIPIVVFILVMFTSQMIISAISTEKIDKTLETLLSAPVSRISVLGAKMLAAAIVAIINAAVYMVGFYGYMGSMLDGAVENTSLVSSALTINDIMKELGLKIGISGFILVGLQMFMTIVICLAASLILGALVNDAKSAQTMLMPIMVLAMVPYFVSMLYDINMLSPVARTLVYAIPFTHTFNAMNNIMFGNMELYWFGLAYQFVLFIVCMFFAVRIFTSDKIFTISLNFGQKKKFRSKHN
ncbi:MAG: ABC transporter permease [Oscillospiraceae bacterium]|nr:ABC transporter permease [Oscillospiraceae bacterium]